MTAGLEIWSVPVGPKGKQESRFVLADKSPDGRFSDDVAQWNSAVVGLNATALKRLKDATK
jgi:hypothetical protein